LLAEDVLEQTVLHLAVMKLNTKELQKLREWAKKKVNAEELKNIFLSKTII
jgi:hypothetical protein